MATVLPISAWPRRYRICLECRTLLGGVATCACGSDALVDLSEAGRATLVDRVWGELDHRDPVNRPAAALLLVGGLMVGFSLLMFNEAGLAFGAVSIAAGGVVRVARVGLEQEDRRPRRTALPAGNAPLLLPSPRVFGGEVVTEHVCRAPMSFRYSVAYAVELRDESIKHTFMRDSATIGFAIEANDGRKVIVPAGPIQVTGGASRAIVLEDLIRAYLTGCDPLWHPDRYDPFPYATALEAIVCEGDVVEVHNELVPVHDAEQVADYRHTATHELRPVGIPRINIVSRAS